MMLLHAQIMHDVVSFLEDHDLKPTSLAIHGDGWVEAYFVNVPKAVWHNLEKTNKVELEQPLLEVQQSGKNTLRVKFRIKAQVSRWQRLKKLIS